MQLDELPVGTERSVDLLLDVLPEPLASHPVVEQPLVLDRRREQDPSSIKESFGKVPGTLPGPLGVCKPNVLQRPHLHSRHSPPPSIGDIV